MDDVMMQHLLRVAYKIKGNKLPYSQQVYFNECGTPACLAGYACEDNAFVAAGLRVRKKTSEISQASVPIWGPDGDEWMGGDAMANLLGLNFTQATFIFGSVDEIAHVEGARGARDHYNTIDNVIRRIERVLDGEFAD